MIIAVYTLIPSGVGLINGDCYLVHVDITGEGNDGADARIRVC